MLLGEAGVVRCHGEAGAGVECCHGGVREAAPRFTAGRGEGSPSCLTCRLLVSGRCGEDGAGEKGGGREKSKVGTGVENC